MNWQQATRPTGWVGQRFQHGYAWSPRMLVYGNALRITYQGLITCLSHMERHPIIMEILIPNTRHKERSPLLGGSRFTTHHYINTRPPLSSGTLKIPNSLTKELIKISHSLTWPSKGFWPIPHRCLLLILLFLFTGIHWSDLEPTTY